MSNTETKTRGICIDLETSGTNPRKDRIIQVAALVIDFGGSDSGVSIISEHKIIVNPQISIPQEATAIHGITDENVKDCQPFSRYAKSIGKLISDCMYILTYNGNSFDVPFLINEFNRAGLQCPFDFDKHVFIDVLHIERGFYDFTLSGTYERRMGKPMEGAHDAMNDVRATLEVFLSQLQEPNFDTAKKRAETQRYKKFEPSPGGDVIVRYGKYGNHTLSQIKEKDKNYLNWMLTNTINGCSVYEIGLLTETGYII